MAKMTWKSANDLLEDEKNKRKDSLSHQCEQSILNGFKSDYKGETYHFSYDREAQSNYQERWQLFQNNMIESIVVTGHTLEGSDVRLNMNKEQFDKLYLDSVMHKENCIKKLRDDLFPLIDNAKAIQDIESVNWDVEVIEPKPETIIVKDDKLLNEEVKRLEAESALGTSEIMTLIMLAQMRGMN